MGTSSSQLFSYKPDVPVVAIDAVSPVVEAESSASNRRMYVLNAWCSDLHAYDNLLVLKSHVPVAFNISQHGCTPVHLVACIEIWEIPLS